MAHLTILFIFTCTSYCLTSAQDLNEVWMIPKVNQTSNGQKAIGHCEQVECQIGCCLFEAPICCGMMCCRLGQTCNFTTFCVGEPDPITTPTTTTITTTTMPCGSSTLSFQYLLLIPIILVISISKCIP